MKILTSDAAYSKIDEQNIMELTDRIEKILNNAQIYIPHNIPLELSHHYGISNFFQYGCIIINLINRAYCKKIIILLPGQENPLHMHKIKEETFHILNGDMLLTVEKEKYNLKAGELFTIEQGMLHSFYSKAGCIFEEISTTHIPNDSYYIDPRIMHLTHKERKTLVIEWQY